MTTSVLPSVLNDDDEDSVYDAPVAKASNANEGETVVNVSEDNTTQLDSILDAEEDQHILELSSKSHQLRHDNAQPGDDDDLRFDSDEQADVESIQSTDDEASVSPDNYLTRPSFDETTNEKCAGVDISTVTKMAATSSHSSLPPSSSNPQSSSLFLRASQTFYKTFIKRKPSSSEQCLSAQIPVHTKATNRSNKSTSQPAQTTDGKHGVNSECDTECTEDKLERLCQLLDAQLSALAGAKTGFVQLALLRPLAEQTLHAVDIDARALLTEYGEAEAEAQRARNEVIAAQKRGEEEILRKERILVEAKVALAEAHGDVERLRGELASAKRALADPSRKLKGQRKKAEAVRRETVMCREARAAVEERLAERRRSLDREQVELSRLEKEYRDIEGDWT